MRINSTLYSILKDHLGSASVITDASGTILGTQRYYPFGETRLTTGTIYTDKLFTGQREMAGLGIYHYQARFYSPKLGRFLSADTILPSFANPQNLNRYTYTLNNPIRYIDPSGHVTCQGANWDDGPQCVGTAEFTKKATTEFRTVLKKRYNWNVATDFTLQELNTLYQTGRDIEGYVDGLTGGNGLDWMHYAFGNTTIEHGYHSDGHSDAMPFLGENFGARIRLDQNWLTHSWGAKELFAHELGHVWDINSGFVASGKMNKDLGGSSWCYFCAPGNGAPQWAKDYHPSGGNAYGNTARNEYFAEAFSATIYNSTYTPNGVSEWIKIQISIDLVGYLFPGGIQ